MDTWDQVVALRTGFAAQVKELTPAEWDAPTLCEGWRVRDVVAHLILPDRFSLLGGLLGFIRAGFRLDRFIHRDAIVRGSVPVPELLASFHAGIHRRSVPPGRQPANVLADLVIHLQDIRRPLGLDWSYNGKLLETVASTIYPDKALGVPKRVAGLSLRATDTEWAEGDGVEVSGPLEALILTMAGRRVTLPMLTGTGRAVLAARIGGHSPALPGSDAG
jgi:uncharacterized protein (TIGR03083 family)